MTEEEGRREGEGEESYFVWFNHHRIPKENFPQNFMKIGLDLAEILRINKLDWRDGEGGKGRRGGILLCNGLIFIMTFLDILHLFKNINDEYCVYISLNISFSFGHHFSKLDQETGIMPNTFVSSLPSLSSIKIYFTMHKIQ